MSCQNNISKILMFTKFKEAFNNQQDIIESKDTAAHLSCLLTIAILPIYTGAIILFGVFYLHYLDSDIFYTAILLGIPSAFGISYLFLQRDEQEYLMEDLLEDDSWDDEVIGNIYENPELLKES